MMMYFLSISIPSFFNSEAIVAVLTDPNNFLSSPTLDLIFNSRLSIFFFVDSKSAIIFLFFVPFV